MSRPKRSLGQHFLTDPEVVRRICAALPASPAALVEIGPGRGALTETLLDQKRPLVVIEKDTQLAQRWREENRIRGVLELDAAETEWTRRLSEFDESQWGVVGNLPYNVGTVILRKLVFSRSLFPWIVIMLQREVAERIEATERRRVGPMGLWTQLYYTVATLMDVPAGAFAPPPRVHSRVLILRRRETALSSVDDEAAWRLAGRLFHRRRARLDSAVANVGRTDRTIVQQWFSEAGISEDARPDHLDPMGFAALAGRLL